MWVRGWRRWNFALLQCYILFIVHICRECKNLLLKTFFFKSREKPEINMKQNSRKLLPVDVCFFFFLFCALLLKGYSNVILYIRYWLVLRLFNLYSFGMMMAQLWKNYGWTRSCKKVPCLNYFRLMLRTSQKLSPVFYALNLIGLLNEWHGSYAYMIIFLGQLNSWWG